MLTGLYEPTSGKARIAGYDIDTDINDVHSHMGVCPQFDIQHASLTAEEHLLFYARLKGVKRSREKAVVERALRQVNNPLVRNLLANSSPQSCVLYKERLKLRVGMS